LFAFTKKKKPYALIILDGWGLGPIWGGNAIALAKTKYFSELWKNYPTTTLEASGKAVGLPDGSPGNSEAGHLNIGAGYVVDQDQPMIDSKISDGTFFNNPILTEAMDHAINHRSALHILGILSDKSAHGNINHLFALLKLAKNKGLKKVFIHLFSDGRDSTPTRGIELIAKVEKEIQEIGIGQISSIIGRFYAMDRDNRYDRLAKAYNLLVEGIGTKYETPTSVFAKSYSRNLTDEFIEPSMIVTKNQSFHKISNNDTVIFYNLRIDRTKPLIKCFNRNFKDIPLTKLSNIYFVSFTMSGESDFAKHPFTPEHVNKPLCEIWSDHKLSQYHISETEKYVHITFFFNGGNEKPHPYEIWRLIPSPKNVRTYDKQPEMNALKLTDSVLTEIKKGSCDVYVINYPNPDMVGHTGNLKAAIQAVECIDSCLSRLIPEILKQDGVAFITADHGNAEQMVNPQTGDIDTEHTTNPVPFLIIGNDPNLKKMTLKKGKALDSIASTVLEVMGIDSKMYNKSESLIEKNG